MLFKEFINEKQSKIVSEKLDFKVDNKALLLLQDKINTLAGLLHANDDRVEILIEFIVNRIIDNSLGDIMNTIKSDIKTQALKTSKSVLQTDLELDNEMLDLLSDIIAQYIRVHLISSKLKS